MWIAGIAMACDDAPIVVVRMAGYRCAVDCRRGNGSYALAVYLHAVSIRLHLCAPARLSASRPLSPPRRCGQGDYQRIERALLIGGAGLYGQVRLYQLAVDVRQPLGAEPPLLLHRLRQRVAVY